MLTVLALLFLIIISLLIGFIIGVVLCTETEADITNDDVSRETSERTNKHEWIFNQPKTQARIKITTIY